MDKSALHKISYGLYIISTGTDNQLNGQIANTAFQITADPPRIAVCINKKNYTHALISHSGVLAVTVLDQQTPMELIGKFGFKSGREVDKFNQISYRRGVTGVPVVLEHSVAFIEAEVDGSLDVGTHTIFSARVVDCGELGTGEPLTYAHYHTVKKGRSPKSAPTYIGDANGGQAKLVGISPEQEVTKYRCDICGYIYEPAQGDPESGITPGTSFMDLPDTWVCPICGAGKEEFEKED